ncbi:hypothetical protein [Halomicrococcus sp. NG-SE-24]|uniref:hypothetical protein n=1 Tax=Halomicrococcus sp. NG-SE-24 TaxID=3436928 RepID=UPI003D98FFCB
MNPFERNVDGYYDVEDQLPTYLRSMAERQFAAAERERATTHDVSVDHGVKMYDVVDALDVPHLLAALSNRDVERVPFPDGAVPAERLRR